MPTSVADILRAFEHLSEPEKKDLAAEIGSPETFTEIAVTETDETGSCEPVLTPGTLVLRSTQPIMARGHRPISASSAR